MVKRFLCLILLYLLATSLPLLAQATRGVALTCDLLEKTDTQPWQVVDTRSYLAPLGRSFQFSMGNVSCDFNSALENDSTVSLQERVSCFDYHQRNFFDRHLVTLGASYFYDSVVVRDDALYRVRITVDSLTEWKPDCSLMFAGGDFHVDPSGDFDIYFVPESLGDYRWNMIRDAYEKNLDYIRDRVDFKEPTRVDLFVAPCRVNDVGWDLRWGNAFDYARNALFIHYTHGVNTIFPQTVFMLKLVRHWGYSPALLLEGAGSMVELCDAFAQDYLRAGELPELSTLGRSEDFRALPRERSSYAAGSFVNYLIGSRGLEKLRNYYQTATDLTLTESFAKVYGEDFMSVEQEWKDYLDTLVVGPGAYVFYRDRAFNLMKLDESTYYQEKLLAETGDTLQLGPTLANYYYIFGEYDKAAKMYRAVSNQDSASTITKAYLANLLLIQGEVDKAKPLYLEAAVTDSGSYLPDWKLGLIAQADSEYSASLEYFQAAKKKTNSIPIRVDINTAIGDSYRFMGKEDSAWVYFQIALDTAKWLLSTYEDRPLYHLRVGKAALRLGQGEVALEQLKQEFFLEERMYYIGQILLAMGQAYDELGKRDEAVAEYRKLFQYPTGWLERRQAENYINDPYFYR